MHTLLTDIQKFRHEEFKEFASAHVKPEAQDWDRAERIPESAISMLAGAGYLGINLPTAYGGKGWDTVTFGLLNEALGRDMAALTDLLTVQSMVSMTLLRWGTVRQKADWLPVLASGDRIAAFALTEPSGGSDLQSLKTEFESAGAGELLLSGSKTWISYGQTADLFLVFGTLDQKPVSCLVPRDSEGLQVRPIRDMMGFRAAGLAQVTFDRVRVPVENMVGKPGVALSYIAPVGLHYGRISTACSALGLLRGCFEESVSRAANRKIGAGAASDFGMIRAMIAGMGTDLEAASLLCYSACRAADDGLPEAFTSALMAKYFASKAAVRAASDAVQIHGASGCHQSSPVSRYYRDAKIMEIIEGTSQIHEDLLGRSFVNAAPKTKAVVTG